MIKAAAIFSDNMVLQSEKPVLVWGKTDSKEEIFCEIGGVSSKAIISGGKWRAVLPPFSVQEGLSLEVRQGESRLVFNNVAFGEVWLAGGQSNMEWAIHDTADGAEVLADIADMKIRYYQQPKFARITDELVAAEEKFSWTMPSPENSREWSAVAVHFAKKIAEETGAVVGIIGCNWGGTSASCWQSRESLCAHEATLPYIKEFDDYTEGKSEAEQIAEYKAYTDYHEAWSCKVEEYYRTSQAPTWEGALEFAGENRYPGPHSVDNPMRPTGLYHSMLKRVTPYTIRGFIYYQGETDEIRPHSYYQLFSSLIQQWRNDWNDDELPFLFVQLPMYADAVNNGELSWAVIREAQRKVWHTVKNTSMAVIAEFGEEHDIHPRHKIPVGNRLALLALKDVYGLSVKAYAPEPEYIVSDNDSLLIYIRNTYGGLKIVGECNEFEVAGDDGVFHAATVEIDGETALRAASKAVPQPSAVRYCWSHWCKPSVFNSENQPLTPFSAEI